MNERTQRALDGEIPRTELTRQDRRALASAEAMIDATLRAVPVRPLPDLAPPVLERIARRDESRSLSRADAVQRAVGTLRTATRWLWRPQSFAVNWRPVYMLAGAALAFVLFRGSRDDAGRVTESRPVLTQFMFTAPEAERVALAGDFSGWQPSYAMQRTGGRRGVWVVVVPLEPGIHNYSFVVDGQRWVADPMSPSYDDGFGGVNSRLAVLASDAGRQQ